jgi:Tol biopolymer transport system component/predicted Ser/Thr protein kinase
MTGEAIAHYRIIGKLGEGGMGEVYRAVDTKLDREVALKILPHSFASDTDRMARFEREAKVLASLNHPNIAQIYGVEERALVMELVEGETLKGPLPIDTALDYARQIAEALEAAHEKGIVHRDLKPANIKVTPQGVVKVLDFGLAAFSQTSAGAGSNSANSPTLTISPTMAGMILGTAAYMSPEQARGKPVDKRADIWAFGVVLYEILTGRQLFQGETVSDILAGVLKEQPDLSAVPLRVRRLIGSCLEKDPKKRLRDIGDYTRLLETEGGAEVPSLERTPLHARPTGWIVATGALLLALLASLSFLYFRKEPPAAHVVTRFEYTLPEEQNFTRTGRHVLAISPDGSKLVYVANQQLYLRAMDQLEAQPIRGTNEDPMEPVFSPDSQWLAYFVPAGEVNSGSAWVLKKIAVAGGAPLTLCRLPVAPFGASWSNGTIAFAINTPNSSSAQAIPDSGGSLRALVTGDPKKEQVMQPQLLPDGKHLLFVSVPASANSAGEAQIVVQRLDGKERRTLISGGSAPRILPSGQLLYIHAGTLLGAPFDISRLAVTGGPVPLVEGITETPTTFSGQFAISPDGTLAFSPGGYGAGGERVMVWVDRQGHEEPISAKPRAYAYARLSPDGTKIATSSIDKDNDIWVFDLAKNTLTRLTFGPTVEAHPAWTPDSKNVFFSSSASNPGATNSPADIFRKAADGTGKMEALTQHLQGGYPLSISPDGKMLVFRKFGASAGFLFLLPLDPKGEPRALIGDPKFSDNSGEISPDGRWIAYDSNESGRREVYVRPFPEIDRGRWQVSSEGGSEPVWARSGRELFFLTGANRMDAVPVQAGAGFNYGQPQPLFDANAYLNLGFRSFDISADGKRFLMLKDAARGNTAVRPSIVVVSHWFDDVNRRIPAGGAR